MSSFPSVFELAAIVVAGTMVGNELAVALFVHPRISALDDATYARAAQALAVAFGHAMLFWYALTFLLSGVVAFYSRRAGTPGHGPALWAMGLFAATIIYTVLLPVPINNQIARWQPDTLPANWWELRRCWDTLHAVRMVVLLIALALLVAARIAPPAA